jgi:hypothetical protein
VPRAASPAWKQAIDLANIFFAAPDTGRRQDLPGGRTRRTEKAGRGCTRLFRPWPLEKIQSISALRLNRKKALSPDFIAVPGPDG